ncbi:hypothetical protein CfE428DRAFT_4008 [Chthoniobacter flavus Ellin428]|uniref:Uncharacterized protein n=2 Tax=Chthoniobacter flavus TaxID=191863 RepID=B4D519_9BACT|nr:hypothetical protein CfE428DRAFT_4008 [Chthoniobacter flavus Ellin428]TCO90922.1 hypothetical protein EV701_10971 [Chthoniobacter flavus]
MGTSAKMIRENYNESKDEQEGLEYFAQMPDASLSDIILVFAKRACPSAVTIRDKNQCQVTRQFIQ